MMMNLSVTILLLAHGVNCGLLGRVTGTVVGVVDNLTAQISSRLNGAGPLTPLIQLVTDSLRVTGKCLKVDGYTDPFLGN